MRRSFLLLLAVSPLAVSPLAAQQLTKADSNLVYAILTAEDRRDSTAPALAEGMRHTDARIRLIAERARGRITDSTFAARSTLPAPAPRVRWPLPAWRARYDSLRIRRSDCTAMAAALRDPVLQVRLRATDLLPAACADSGNIIPTLVEWITHLPDPPVDFPRPAAWHSGAHALVALARLRPEVAKVWIDRLATHGTWQVRMYVARAAQYTADSGLLRRLVRLPDGNVAEAAILSLSALGGHQFDATYLEALRSIDPQVVRAAAVALKGSPRTDPALAANAVFSRWRARRVDSERDVRRALLDLMGRPYTEDAAERAPDRLPWSVVRLALGDDVRLQMLLPGETWCRCRDTAAHRPELIDIRLRGDIAPITAGRILDMVEKGKYMKGTWHRVVTDFVIQGGLEGDNEYLGGDRYFRDELGNLSHLRGSVGMSTRGHDSGDGQWFIDLSDLPRLDQDYTIFGEVLSGMSRLDTVLEGDSVRLMVIPPRLYSY
jgi:cyclophilin family peptidyl-prolyl cis-trans isomerase